VGCLGWASAAWKIAPRDRHICWTAECQRTRLHLLANNVRFLFLLGIQIRYLASQVLSVWRLSDGWTHRYGHPLYLAETFVDLSRVAGTCYRAANWYCVGQT
jgi:Druantia protein DruA